MKQPFIVGVDFGSKDENVEVVCRALPNGTLEMVSSHRHKKTIDLEVLPTPEITITKSVCAAFKSGFCYSADNPFYSGHYETSAEALAAAEQMKADRSA